VQALAGVRDTIGEKMKAVPKAKARRNFMEIEPEGLE
jgi:hypothetical protein